MTIDDHIIYGPYYVHIMDIGDRLKSQKLFGTYFYFYCYFYFQPLWDLAQFRLYLDMKMPLLSCLWNPGGHDRVFVSMVAAPLLPMMKAIKLLHAYTRDNRHILTVTLWTVDEQSYTSSINVIQSLHLSTDHPSALKNKCQLTISLKGESWVNHFGQVVSNWFSFADLLANTYIKPIYLNP